jgi:egghead protein (zeste-white 4 protein)
MTVSYWLLVAGVFRNKAEKTTLISLEGTMFERPYQILLWTMMACFLPGVILNTSGHILYPAFAHTPILPMFGKPDDEPVFPRDYTPPKWRLHFRWVTRGDNPNLVASTIRETRMLLAGMNMNPANYVLEVVTDNAIHCAELSGVAVEEIVVPNLYRSSTGAKFKARALNYAIHHSTARDCDWIVHLDEETKISERVVAHLWNHVETELQALKNGKRFSGYANIGQGAILYGAEKHGAIGNWITTLSDTGRVGDDYGKFRMQYEHDTTLIGMHGSYIIISQPVEEAVTYDHGHAGSICEDLYFALVALGKYDIGYSWVDGFMYEQSPFSLMDLVKQRQRWFSGMFLVVLCPEVPFKCRWKLACLSFSWNLLPVIAVVMVVMTFIHANESWYLATAMATLNTLMMSSYVIGFVMSYRLEDGWIRYLILFSMQINGAPLFGILEAMGAFRALTKSEAYMGFHVVQKEVGGKSGNSSDESGLEPPSRTDAGLTGSDEHMIAKMPSWKGNLMAKGKPNAESALESVQGPP